MNFLLSSVFICLKSYFALQRKPNFAAPLAVLTTDNVGVQITVISSVNAHHVMIKMERIQSVVGSWNSYENASAKNFKFLLGSDNADYPSLCHLQLTECLEQKEIKVKKEGKCGKIKGVFEVRQFSHYRVASAKFRVSTYNATSSESVLIMGH